MSRRRRVIHKEEKQDSRYGSPLVARLIGTVMKSGKKSLAERVVYDAIEQSRVGSDVVDPLDAARAVVEAAASTHGVILGHHASSSTAAETAEGGAFDIVVLNRALAPPNIPAMLLRETAALLRQGGRVIVIEGGMTPGVLGVGRRPIPPAMPGDAIRDLLSSASFRAARVLAESEGAVYVEAQEP